MTIDTTTAITLAARAAALDALTKALDPVLTAISEEAANAAVREAKEQQPSEGSVPSDLIEQVREALGQVEQAQSELSSLRNSVEDWESQINSLHYDVDSSEASSAESACDEAQSALEELITKLEDN